MIKLKVSSDDLLAMSQDPTFGPLVQMLTILGTKNMLTGNEKPSRDGSIMVDEKRFDLATIVAAAGQGIEYPDGITVYCEVPAANWGDDVPSYFPNASRVEYDEETDESVLVKNTYGDLITRKRLDDTAGVMEVGVLDVAELGLIIAEPIITPMLHAETVALVNTIDYVTPEI